MAKGSNLPINTVVVAAAVILFLALIFSVVSSGVGTEVNRLISLSDQAPDEVNTGGGSVPTGGSSGGNGNDGGGGSSGESSSGGNGNDGGGVWDAITFWD